MKNSLTLAQIGFIIQCIGTLMMFIPICLNKPFPDLATKVFAIGLFINLGSLLFKNRNNNSEI